MTHRFRRFELRTTEADAARGFYSRLLGHDRAIVWPLHEQAIARGAVPHWLGSIDVGDAGLLARVSGDFVSRGAMALGPIRPTPGGGQISVVRDPGGAIVGVSALDEAELGPTIEVGWHVLSTNDEAAAIANYEILFGWTISKRAELGPAGSFHEFWWGADAAGPSAGAIAGVAGRPGVHPHWLFFFRVDSLDHSVEAARREGGTASDPVDLANGGRVSICEDPQGAAFGLLECTSD